LDEKIQSLQSWCETKTLKVQSLEGQCSDKTHQVESLRGQIQEWQAQCSTARESRDEVLQHLKTCEETSAEERSELLRECEGALLQTARLSSTLEECRQREAQQAAALESLWERAEVAEERAISAESQLMEGCDKCKQTKNQDEDQTTNTAASGTHEAEPSSPEKEESTEWLAKKARRDSELFRVLQEQEIMSSPQSTPKRINPGFGSGVARKLLTEPEKNASVPSRGRHRRNLSKSKSDADDMSKYKLDADDASKSDIDDTNVITPIKFRCVPEGDEPMVSLSATDELLEQARCDVNSTIIDATSPTTA